MSTIISNPFWLSGDPTCKKQWNNNPGGLGMTKLLPAVNGVAALESKVDWNGDDSTFGWQRGEIKQVSPGADDRYYSLCVKLVGFKFETKRNFLVAQWKPGENYPTLSIWCKETSTGSYTWTLVRMVNSIDGGNIKNANTKTYETPLVPAAVEKQFAITLDVKKWSSEKNGVIDVYIAGAFFKTVTGPNMDKLLPGATVKQNYRCGLYVFSNKKSVKPKYPVMIGQFTNVNVGSTKDSTLKQFL